MSKQTSKPFPEALDGYLHYVEHVQAKPNAPQTMRRKRGQAKMLKAIWGGRCLHEVTPDDVEAWISNRVHSGISVATTNRDLTLIKTLYKHAARKGWVAREHAAIIREIPGGDEGKHLVRPLLQDEEPALFGAPAGRYLMRTAEFSILTGIRQGELVGMRWPLVMWKEGIFRVTGKGRKDRWVPMNEEALPILQEIWNEQTPEQREGHVFLNSKGQPWTEDGLRGMWRKKIKIPSGLVGDRNFRYHDLRATAASRALSAGADIRVIQQLLGHESIQTTERYAQADLEAVKAAVGLIRLGPRKGPHRSPRTPKAPPDEATS